VSAALAGLLRTNRSPGKYAHTEDGSLELYYSNERGDSLSLIVSACPVGDGFVPTVTQLDMQAFNSATKTRVRFAPPEPSIGDWIDMVKKEFGESGTSSHILLRLMGTDTLGGRIRSPMTSELLDEMLSPDDMHGGLSNESLSGLVARQAERDDYLQRIRPALLEQGRTSATLGTMERKKLIELFNLLRATPLVLEPLEWLLIPPRLSAKALVDVTRPYDTRKLLSFLQRNAGPTGNGRAWSVAYLGGLRLFPVKLEPRSQWARDILAGFDTASRGVREACLAWLLRHETASTIYDDDPRERLNANENVTEDEFIQRLKHFVLDATEANPPFRALARQLKRVLTGHVVEPPKSKGKLDRAESIVTPLMYEHYLIAEEKIKQLAAPGMHIHQLLPLEILLNSIAQTQSWPRDKVLDKVLPDMIQGAEATLLRMERAASYAWNEVLTTAEVLPPEDTSLLIGDAPSTDPLTEFLKLPRKAILNMLRLMDIRTGHYACTFLNRAYDMDLSFHDRETVPGDWTPRLKDHLDFNAPKHSIALRVLFRAESQGLHVSQLLRDCADWTSVRRKILSIGPSGGARSPSHSLLVAMQKAPEANDYVPRFTVHQETLEAFLAFITERGLDISAHDARRIVGGWMCDLERCQQHFSGNPARMAVLSRPHVNKSPANAFLDRTYLAPSVKATVDDDPDTKNVIGPIFMALFDYFRPGRGGFDEFRRSVDAEMAADK